MGWDGWMDTHIRSTCVGMEHGTWSVEYGTWSQAGCIHTYSYTRQVYAGEICMCVDRIDEHHVCWPSTTHPCRIDCPRWRFARRQSHICVGGHGDGHAWSAGGGECGAGLASHMCVQVRMLWSIGPISSCLQAMRRRSQHSIGPDSAAPDIACTSMSSSLGISSRLRVLVLPPLRGPPLLMSRSSHMANFTVRSPRSRG